MHRPSLRTTRFFAIATGAAVLAASAAWVGLAPAQAQQAQVQVWVTTADQSRLLAQQPDVSFGSGGSGPVVNVNAGTSYQVMDGFGASFTDSSAWLVDNELTQSQRDQLMIRLFDDQSGIGLSMVRQPMGASDFTAGGADYTYDDTCCSVGDFTIGRDQASVIPVLQQAKGLNPDLKIIGTPWTAPAWMKSSGSLNGGQLNADRFDEYADYFEAYVDAYAAQGLPIYAVTSQNEPQHETGSYPSMRMSWQDQAAFIGDHLGPALADTGTRIIAWDHNWDQPEYAINVLNDPEANRYLAGSAFHCYAGNVAAQTQVRNAHPGKGVWFTECSGGQWAPDFGSNLKWNTQNLVIGATRNWAKSVTLWNMALDQNHGPTNGGCADCRGVVTIDTNSGNVTYNVEYYVLGHVSKFVDPGAVRVESSNLGGDIETTAFRNPDGSRVLLALNAGASQRTFTVTEGGRQFGYTLPAGAVATFTWNEGGTSEPPGGIDPDAVYAIASLSTGKVLDVRDRSTAEGAQIQQWADFGATNQRWRFTDAGGGHWTITSVFSGKVLAVPQSSTANGALVVQQTYTGAASQQWRVEASGGGYAIVNRHSGKVLDVQGVSQADGAAIQQWDDFGAANQRWSLTPDG
ncbi:glucosylceramidase [Glycomyces sambucus]|uniref:Glucosylceramidase n=1 Tax=Glycomyces sambucus TaxID=380244 RepID=A0A1G9II64_9ACTN|nr:RICIN domain-containing protein [Glycomyces sambucus]SDL24624.1 glucosylceramidase [Glycomyces sambucus]